MAVRRELPVAYAAIDSIHADVGQLDLWVDVSARGLGIEDDLVAQLIAAARYLGLRELRRGVELFWQADCAAEAAC